MIKNIDSNYSTVSSHYSINEQSPLPKSVSTSQMIFLQSLNERKFSCSKILYYTFFPIIMIWKFITAPFRAAFNIITSCCRPKTKIIEQPNHEKFNAILKLADEEKYACRYAFDDIEKIPKHIHDSRKSLSPDEAKEQLRLHAQKGLQLLIDANQYASTEEEKAELHARTMVFLVYIKSENCKGCTHQIELGLDKLSGTPQEKYKKAYEIAMSQREAINPYAEKCNSQNSPYWENDWIKFYATNGINFINKVFQYATSNQEKAQLYFELAVFSFILGKEKEGSKYVAETRSLGFDKKYWADSTEKAYLETIRKHRPK